ncbi:multidrug effflux MFS transporter [Aureimonas fodinaquatilis]|uniref:Bcr/CflA family efflux transporter n=1 Tax=Aureimonas fodinaquatilis TaxID=2565783 RepID=A0A5B0DXW9_9HYPH|nr:multidrug effflux MFS transporter [Aureimonas fodinaquatilis]
MVLSLICASALSPLAINIFIPSMASIASDLSADPTTIALGLSLFLVMVAAVQLVAGPLSDKFGRKPVILAGMMLYLLGTLLCIYAQDGPTFLAGRVIQASSATGMVLSRAIVRDLFSRDKAASMIGYVTMGLAVAPLFGPAIGGVLDTWLGWRSVFWLLAVCGVITTALIAFFLPETNQSRGKPMLMQLNSYRFLFRSLAFWRYASTAALISAVFFGFLGGAPFIASHILGMSPAEYGLWFMVCSLGYILGNFITGRMSQRVGINRMMVIGSSLTLFSAVITLVCFLAGYITPTTLFLPMLVLGVGNGLSVPTSVAGGVSVQPEAAGAAAGLLGAFQMGICACAAAFASALAHSPIAVATFMVVMGVLGTTCAVLREPR